MVKRGLRTLFDTMFLKLILLKKSEIKVSERSILTLFDTMFWKLVLLKESEIKVAKRCLLTLFETTFLETNWCILMVFVRSTGVWNC